jgi:hypothetical protein
MTLSNRLRSRLGLKAAAMFMIACGASAVALAPSTYAQATTTHPAITGFVHLSRAAAMRDHVAPATSWVHIGNSDSQCLDANSNQWGQNGDNVQLWACNNNGEQLWTVSGAHIVNEDGQCLDANSNQWGQNGDNVQLWGCNSNGEQSWSLQLQTGHIVNADGQCLDANSNQWGQNGDNVQLWACNSNGEQIWPQG